MSPSSRLRADFVPAKLVRAVAVGWLMGAVIVIHCIALSAIVFSGPMLPFAVQGAGMMLFGGVVFCLLIGVTSSYPGMLAVPQEVPATVIGTLGAAVVGSTAGGPDAASFMTMAAMLVLSGLLTGRRVPCHRAVPAVAFLPLHPLSGRGGFLRRNRVGVVAGRALGDERGGS